jgi:hypothetical protein
MPAAVARLLDALTRDAIPFCAWKGVRALEGALRGERDLDGLVRPADFERALRTIEGAGWKRATPRRGAEAQGLAHFYAYEPALLRLLHLHLHDQLLSGEDWINSHALPFAHDFLASPRRAHGVRVPEPAGEAALLVLKHAIRWGSWPDRVTSRLRPTREVEESAALLDEGTLAAAAALVAARCPALDPATFRACASALLREPRERRGLARRVRAALAPWQRQTGFARARAYAAVAAARLRRAFDGNRAARGPAAGALTVELFAVDAARARSAADALTRWLAPTFAARAVDAQSLDARTLRAAGAAREILFIAGPLPAPLAAEAPRLERIAVESDEAALRAAVWRLL